jgi:invasion protein IalB
MRATCFVGIGLRTICEPLAAATLISGERAPSVLRVTVPMHVIRESGTRIAIDDGASLTQPIVACLTSGCVSDYPADAELVARLRQGTKLVVEAVGGENQPLSFTLPLAGFAQALDRPSFDPKIFEMSAEERRQLAAPPKAIPCAR